MKRKPISGTRKMAVIDPMHVLNLMYSNGVQAPNSYTIANERMNVFKRLFRYVKRLFVILAIVMLFGSAGMAQNPEWIQKDGKWYKMDEAGPSANNAEISANAFGSIGAGISVIDQILKLTAPETNTDIQKAKAKRKLAVGAKKLGKTAIWLNKQYEKGNISLTQFLVLQKTLLPTITAEEVQLLSLEITIKKDNG